ncbi:hypothetical protein J2808_004408 [Pseudarthrobacter sulfonivorans]|nr:hypothetical protein [Pseudarthrobacter sulfonivorans]
MRARGGTRTAFQPLQTLGTRANISNPSQSNRNTAQSEAKSVDTVNIPKFADSGFSPPTAPRNEGASVLLCADIALLGMARLD